MTRFTQSYLQKALLLVALLRSAVLFAQPPNDDCAGAQTIACGQNINATTVGATIEVVPAGCYLNNTAPSVWYTFTGDGSNVLLSLCVGSTFDTQLAVYTGTCAALTCLVFNDDACGVQSQVSFSSGLGVIYYVRVFGYGGSSGPFQLSMTCSPITVSNDGCANAIPMTCPQTETGTTIGATADAIPGGCFVTNITGGVWYSFVGNGSNMTASLCGSSFDTQIAIMTGACGTFTCVGYNDDFCGGQSQMTVGTTNGTTYYIYVFGYSAAQGTFTLSLICAPPPEPPCVDTEPNGCPDIDLGVDISLPTCTIPCIPLSLTAEYFETGTTTSYSACSIPYTPYPYNTGTGFSIGVDDIYTGLINLPFNFCFYGTNYSQCVVGSNGVVTFNSAYANAYCPYGFTASCPNPALPLNSIFGVYHDIDPAVLCGAVPCGDARYATFGTAPCRVFVVSFDNVPHFSFACNSLRTSCEIVLYETTNVIEVFVENKPVCPTWNYGNAMIGIQNSTGTTGISPSGRNTGSWSAVNEGWRFVPTGPSAVNITWSDQTGTLGTGATLSICPTDPTHTYVATATYNRCDGSTVVVTDDIVVQCASFFVPVEWQSFEAEYNTNDQSVNCKWSTASEVDNDYFTIQRSIDGERWLDLGTVDGSGTSHNLNKYAYVDKSPPRGLSYYRIQQTDFNGESKHSEIRSVSRENAFQLYPNPANELLTISPWKDAYSVKTYSANGVEVPCQWRSAGQLEVSHLKPGLYQVEIRDGLTGEAYRFPVMISH